MGIAGFGYVIDSLHAPDDHPNELNEAVRVIASADLDPATILQLTIPALGSLVSNTYYQHIPDRRSLYLSPPLAYARPAKRTRRSARSA